MICGLDYPFSLLYNLDTKKTPEEPKLSEDKTKKASLILHQNPSLISENQRLLDCEVKELIELAKLIYIKVPYQFVPTIGSSDYLIKGRNYNRPID